MSVFLSALLNTVQQYGYPALWVSIFIAAVGLPLPIVLVLLAAGAFAALGQFNIILLTAISISASVAGDNLGYLIGRLWGSKALSWLERSSFGKRFIKPNSVARSRLYFKKRGGWAIFLSRFLVAALGGIINLLSGTELYPYRYFLLFDIAGETLGALIPLLLGFAFGASWDAIGNVIGSLSLFTLGLLIVIFLCMRLLRYARGAQKSRQSSPVIQNTLSAAEVAPMIDPPSPSSGHLPLP
ncbi:MAG TPA: VTT domain-containing protein [Ktedonobacteraceae bacterium]|nr:VTT domain-containing protein [Ktedonobacteraceae bacterium]